MIGNKSRIYDYEQVKKIFKENKYELISPKYNTGKENLLYRDCNGYFYYVSLNTFLANIRTGVDTSKFECGNPMILKNIDLFIGEKLGLNILDFNIRYNSHRIKISVIDKSGYKYSSTFDTLKQMEFNTLMKINSHNPFSVENINVLLKNEDRGFIICENQKYKNSTSKLKFKCLRNNNHKIFERTWDEISGYRDKGCPHCRSENLWGKQLLEYLSVEDVPDWDYETNKDIYPTEFKPGSHTSVNWICEICNKSYPQIIKSHVSKGLRHKECSYEKAVKKKRENISISDKSVVVTHPHLIEEFSKQNNKELKYYTHGSQEQFWWICPKGHQEYFSALNNRTNKTSGGSGCPICSESRGEARIAAFLTNRKIEHLREKWFPTCKFKGYLYYDFYIPKYNVLCEYQGNIHFIDVKAFNKDGDFEEMKLRDAKKKKWAEDNGYNFIEICYWDFDKIEEILKERLNLK